MKLKKRFYDGEKQRSEEEDDGKALKLSACTGALRQIASCTNKNKTEKTPSNNIFLHVIEQTTSIGFSPRSSALSAFLCLARVSTCEQDIRRPRHQVKTADFACLVSRALRLFLGFSFRPLIVDGEHVSQPHGTANMQIGTDLCLHYTAMSRHKEPLADQSS